MRRIVVCVLVFALLGPVTADAAAGCEPGALEVTGTVALTERLHELTLDSDALGRETRVRVLLPEGYASRVSERFPVLLLLHGAGDDHTTWTQNTDVEGITSDLDLIVVMPDGGKNADAGWYTDWATGEHCWESYHIGELVGFVDDAYRTRGDRGGRAIAGLSMGGFGTMSYAARHPDLFAAAGSFSGAVDTADGGLAEAEAFRQLNPYFGTPDERVWGEYASDEVTWRDHNPPDLSPNLRHTDLWFVTGNGVPMPGDNPPSAGAEAGVYPMNRLFAADLTLEGIVHTFTDRGYGTHEWHYWEQDLQDFLPVALARFATDLADPDRFAYRTAEPSFDVFGWSFDVDRDVKEFLDLEGVSRDGFTVTGSGKVHVETPPGYGPGYHLVIVERNDQLRGDVVYVEDGEPLRFAVDLGPSHVHQQYTPEARLAELADPGYWRTARVRIL